MWGSIITGKLQCVINCINGRVKIKTKEGYRIIKWGRNEYRLWQIPLVWTQNKENKLQWNGRVIVIHEKHQNKHLITFYDKKRVMRGMIEGYVVGLSWND